MLEFRGYCDRRHELMRIADLLGVVVWELTDEEQKLAAQKFISSNLNFN